MFIQVSKKLQQTEGDLERAEERAEMNEMKILELEEELKVRAKFLKILSKFAWELKDDGKLAKLFLLYNNPSLYVTVN